MLNITLQTGKDIHFGLSASGKYAGQHLRCLHPTILFSSIKHLFQRHVTCLPSTAETIQKGYIILVQFLYAFSYACTFQFQTNIFRVKYHSENKMTVNLTLLGKNVLNLILLKNQCSFSDFCFTRTFRVKGFAVILLSNPHIDTTIRFQPAGSFSSP